MAKLFIWKVHCGTDNVGIADTSQVSEANDFALPKAVLHTERSEVLYFNILRRWEGMVPGRGHSAGPAEPGDEYRLSSVQAVG